MRSTNSQLHRSPCHFIRGHHWSINLPPGLSHHHRSLPPTPPLSPDAECCRGCRQTDTTYPLSPHAARTESCSNAFWVTHALLRVSDVYHLELPGPPSRPEPLGPVSSSVPTGYGRVLPGDNWFRLVCWIIIHTRLADILFKQIERSAIRFANRNQQSRPTP